MISIGIDVSKSKSTVAALGFGKELIFKPFNIYHVKNDVSKLIGKIKSLDEDVKIVMEATEIYHIPILISLVNEGFFVSVINPLKMKRFCQALSFRNVKTDKKDAIHIAEYGLMNWNDLIEYKKDKEEYVRLKQLNRSYQHYQKLRINHLNYLDKEIEKRHPGLKKLIPNANGNYQKDKLIDFVEKWSNSEKILKRSQEQFVNDYEKWAKKKGYHPNAQKAITIYQNALESIPTISSSNSKIDANVLDSIEFLRVINKTLNNILSQMKEIATELEEYKIAKEFSGIGEKLALQITSEIGNIRKYKNKKSLISFAGIDSPPYQSGNFSAKQRKISKRGNPILRKVLYMAILCMKKAKDETNPVYKYIIKKEREGKAKKVSNIAGINKFLRIYYAKVMEEKNKEELLKAA